MGTADDGQVTRAFTANKVTTLTGLTKRQLQYWDERRFLAPSLSRRGGRGRRRLYDFRDLVSLRVAADLRRQGISLQVIRGVVSHLRDLDYRDPLAELRFWASEGRLYFAEAGTVREGKRPDQTVAEFVIPVEQIVHTLEERISQLAEERRAGGVEKRRGVLGSKAVVAGTRIPVESIQRLRADGADDVEIIELYPDLTRADIDAALSQEQITRRANAG